MNRSLFDFQIDILHCGETGKLLAEPLGSQYWRVRHWSLLVWQATFCCHACRRLKRFPHGKTLCFVDGLLSMFQNASFGHPPLHGTIGLGGPAARDVVPCALRGPCCAHADTIVAGVSLSRTIS
ncbi:MAG: hypothetical protein KGL51_09160 [Betaproteobacteria bacterium]|nr:hypothetical protein [Betaproteobacteria bacterium]MDE2124459.1 hypothetical protein [Betaproteobacteria bacterium]MDE2185765.1 hypothetical protein [Betaproteobacteria bacterium]MDE2324824.1 hypothetical protein [Betaproteobacteria bacterium]